MPESYFQGVWWTGTFRRDALGRQTASEAPDGSLFLAEYDVMGRITKSVDPNGGTTELGYDSNGNLTAILLPHQAGVTYEYDSRNRMTARMDILGQAERWTYDGMSIVTLARIST